MRVTTDLPWLTYSTPGYCMVVLLLHTTLVRILPDDRIRPSNVLGLHNHDLVHSSVHACKRKNRTFKNKSPLSTVYKENSSKMSFSYYYYIVRYPVQFTCIVTVTCIDSALYCIIEMFSVRVRALVLYTCTV